MSAVAKIPDKAVAERKPATLAAVIMERIGSGATIEETRELYKFMREIEMDQARAAFAADFAAMQGELPEIPKRGRIDIGRGKPQLYALWEDVNELIKPVLTRHGFGLMFRVDQGEGKITVTAILRHRTGLTEETSLLLPLDQSGSKNIVQAHGSAVSYGKRYTAGALLNLTARGEDDDGRVAGGNGNGHLTEEQIAKIRERLVEVANDPIKQETRLAQAFGRQAIEDVPAAKYGQLMQKIESFERQKRALEKAASEA